MNLNDIELSHGTCSACGRDDLLVQCSAGDYCCNACLKESIEKPDTGDAWVSGNARVSGDAWLLG